MKGLLDFGEGPDFILTAIVRPLSGVAQDVISQSLLKAHSAVREVELEVNSGGA